MPEVIEFRSSVLNQLLAARMTSHLALFTSFPNSAGLHDFPLSVEPHLIGYTFTCLLPYLK
jgi:hypothetical protein